MGSVVGYDVGLAEGAVVGSSGPQSSEGDVEGASSGASDGCSDGGLGDGGPGFPPLLRVGVLDRVAEGDDVGPLVGT